MPLTRMQLDTWCESLRANPEKQMPGKLFNGDLTKACCLGELALCTNQPLTQKGSLFWLTSANGAEATGYLVGAMNKQLGDPVGKFDALSMPRLNGFASAADANDNNVPWPEIADHFQKYYQCCEDF